MVRCVYFISPVSPDAFVGPVASGSKPFIEFSGDAEEDETALPEGEDVAVDLFAEANAAVEEENEEQGEEDGNEDVEDDFNAAWEVLDLARALYEKSKDTDDEIRLKLADTYITLGDVSLETGTTWSEVIRKIKY